jgi:hypothetical protein
LVYHKCTIGPLLYLLNINDLPLQTSNLSVICYIIKSLKDEVSPYMLKNIYNAKFQSLVSYSLIFCGGESESSKVLIIQKKKDTSSNERREK